MITPLGRAGVLQLTSARNGAISLATTSRGAEGPKSTYYTCMFMALFCAKVKPLLKGTNTISLESQSHIYNRVYTRTVATKFRVVRLIRMACIGMVLAIVCKAYKC